MRFTKHYVLYLVALVVPVACTAIEANELQTYLEEAALNNPGLKAAFNRWKAALQEVPQVKSLPDPRFTYSYYIQEVETRVGPQKQRFGISQVFPWFGTLNLRSDAAMEKAEFERQRYEQEKLSLFNRVKNAFFEYAYLARSLEATRQHLMLLQNMEEVARTRLKAGASQSEAVQVQVELGKLEDQLLTLEAFQQPLSARLSSALNRPDHTLLPWPQPFEGTPADFTDEEILQHLNEDSSELKGLEALIRKESDAVELAHKARYPDLLIGLDYIQTDEAFAFTPDNGKDPFMATISINLPIWFGKLKAGEQEALYRRKAAEYQRVEMENSLTSRLQMALFRFRDAERKIRLYRDGLIPKAEQSLSVTRQSFEAGRDTFSSLIDTERVLLEFQLAADRALADREIQLAEIELITGKGQSRE